MEIKGNLLLELLASELKSSELRELRSREGLEEVGYIMDFEGVFDVSRRVER